MLTSASRSDQGALREELALHTGSSALTFEVCVLRANYYDS
jgi:hypothetical protein